MRLDRQIVLFEPDQVDESFGNTVVRTYIEHTVYANKNARAGRITPIYQGREIIEPVRYTIRYSGFGHITVKWYLEDEGKRYSIQSIYEPANTRRQFLVLVVE